MIIYPKTYREMLAANQIANRAIKAGTLTRPNVCSKCGEEKRIIAHHRDYSKPLEVVWLCDSCHLKEHHENGFAESPQRDRGIFVKIDPGNLSRAIALSKSLPVPPPLSRLINAAINRGLPVLAMEFSGIAATK